MKLKTIRKVEDGAVLVVVYEYLTDQTISNLTTAVERLDKN